MAVILPALLCILSGTAGILSGYLLAGRNGNPAERILSGTGHRFLTGGYLFSVRKRKLLKRLRLEKREEQFYRALYVNKDPELCRLVRECRQGLIAFCMLIGFGILMLFLAKSGSFSDTEIHSFERPRSGTENYRLRATVGAKSYDMEYTVRERVFTAEEVMTAWEEVKKRLPEEILRTNPCADEVTEDLYLPKKLEGTNVDLIWMSTDYRLIDYEGRVYPENAAQDGSIVIVTVQLKYGGYTEFSDIPLRVLKKTADKADTGERLKEELAQSDADQANERVMELPTDLGDTPITFYRKKSRTPWLFAVLFLLLLLGTFCMWGSEEKRLRKEREDQLLRDYPDLVSKITLLMQAGLTLRSAWDRITEDYLSDRNRADTRYVYEEMRNVRNKLNAGVSEEYAYEEFGRNCGNIRYLRLSSVLVQNLKKGTGGLVSVLRKEAAEAFAERKERVKQRGEEAGTKLLIPMAGILVLILAIIMIPAFLSF